MKWYDEQQTILQIISSTHWSWAWLHQHSRDHTVPQLSARTHPTALIIDMGSSTYFPASDLEDNVRTQIDIYRSVDLDVVIIVAAYPWLARMLEAIYRRHGLPTQSYYGVTSIEEAINCIQKSRQQSV